MNDVTPGAQLRGAVDLSSLVNKPTASAATGQAQPLTGVVFESSDATFSQFLDLSSNVPVIVDLWSPRAEPSAELSPVLKKVVTEYNGTFVLVTVDVDANPQLAEAFQLQSIPTVAALIGGRPVPLFTGAIEESKLREVLKQVLALAVQNGVTGRAEVADADQADAEGAQPEPEPEPLPPLHQEAYDAIERGDYDAAITAYTTAIAQDPRDHDAEAGLAQVSLLARLQGKSLDDIRSAAAANPDDANAQLDVADLDLSGGHIDDAFGRLLGMFPTADADVKTAIRQRLLQYFEVVGSADARVAKARAQLTSLLY